MLPLRSSMGMGMGMARMGRVGAIDPYTNVLLLSGDATDGNDVLLLSGDAGNGTDALELSGDARG